MDTETLCIIAGEKASAQGEMVYLRIVFQKEEWVEEYGQTCIGI